jgi:hypothetical protein
MYKINKEEIDENEAQKAVQIANKRVNPETFHRQALADRKPNIPLVHRNKKQVQFCLLFSLTNKNYYRTKRRHIHKFDMAAIRQ